MSLVYCDPIKNHAYAKQLPLWIFSVLLIFVSFICAAQDTLATVSGRVTDAETGQPLPLVNVRITGSNAGARTDQQGVFSLRAAAGARQLTFVFVGYQRVIKAIGPGQTTGLLVRMRRSQTSLTEVKITAGKTRRYRNKGNPAVALIQQVIDHKKFNRPGSTGYLQYDQYERLGLSFYHLSPDFINGKFFSKYKFMLDSSMLINGEKQISLPVFFDEKLSQYYYRRNPEKTITILNAQKQTDVIKFIDTAGLDIYMNRLYGNKIDIYENNIFIITNQLLSPIADHAPDFYKFFIADTIQSGGQKLVELNFTPRNKGDLLFEGKIVVTLDGRYAVAGCELKVNRQININFIRSLDVVLDFIPDSSGHYYLKKSDVKADFGIFKTKGVALFGERTVYYSSYKFNQPMPPEFYNGKSARMAPGNQLLDTAYLAQHRTDTLTKAQALTYKHTNQLENMRSFKRLNWLATTLTGQFAPVGPVQIGPIAGFYSFSTVEGSRFQLGGRTTPALSPSIYLEGYTAYGLRDKKDKYDLGVYFSLNKTPFYRFPNDYFRVNFLYDVDVPGHSYAISTDVAPLVSFQTGKTDFFIYSRIFTIDYVKDFETHFSYDVNFRNWTQQAAGTLVFQYNDRNTPVDYLTTTEAGVRLRFAPHEQILQGTQYRRTIYSKYPIYVLQINHDFKDILHGSYNFTTVSGTITKRFYFSQLGFADATLLGNYLAGKVPFPLLNISPANQSIAYKPDLYNDMDYLEFVSDHYAGINLTQSFNGFFLNKIPLVERLKWREFLSFKILYGGLRNENNPLYNSNLYKFPAPANGSNGTYALGRVPYIEAGAGIGNIFKFLRVDITRRFNYLDHPNTSAYGIKFSFRPDF